MDKIVVLVSGVAGIIFVAWFFFGKKDEEVIAGDSIDIKVEGGYTPSTIVVKKGKKTTINFTRTDPSSCLEEVVLSDFKIRKYLPLKEKVTTEITPNKAGEFPFSCGMSMFHGKIVVKE
jgi:plastocyanin domain-containing protein